MHLGGGMLGDGRFERLVTNEWYVAALTRQDENVCSVDLGRTDKDA